MSTTDKMPMAGGFWIGEGTPNPVQVGHMLAEPKPGEVRVQRPALFILAGPCVIESPEHTLRLAKLIAKVAAAKETPLIFKASFDKANRTSGKAFRGPGLREGLAILAAVRRELGVPVVTDIHEADQADPSPRSSTCSRSPPSSAARPTCSSLRAKRAARQRQEGPVHGPWDMKHVVRTSCEEAGAEKILLTERGTTFGYNNLVVDMRGLVEMRARPAR
jgi:2-dehydro-3-deoxyphosphooctonate aldolase (KDO 8-P synthase)